MSKYDRDSRDVYAVKRLGDEIGYGHLMSIAHELWARLLEAKGFPREMAFVVVGHSMVKDEYVKEAVADPIYKVVVERALADTPQAEKPKWTKENCKGCKYNEYPYDDGTCFVRVCIDGNKYEPKQTDCGWK